MQKLNRIVVSQQVVTSQDAINPKNLFKITNVGHAKALSPIMSSLHVPKQIN